MPAPTESNTQAHQTLKTQHTHRNTYFWLTFKDEQKNSRQLRYTII